MISQPMDRHISGGPARVSYGRDEILDVACGWGEFLLSYANQTRQVAGIDVSKEKVALARPTAPGHSRIASPSPRSQDPPTGELGRRDQPTPAQGRCLAGSEAEPRGPDQPRPRTLA